MKLVFLLAFVGFAAAATLRPEVQIPSNNPNVLVYLYDAQVATGVQEVSDDFSTVRMQFKAVMRAKAASGSESAQRWTVEFEEANVRQRLNATGSQPKLLLPMSQFRNLEDSQQWFSMEQSLKKQFEVEIDPDTLEVTKVFFSNEDPFWSVNVKKGFLHSLQLRFDNSNQALTRSSWINEVDQMTTADKCKTRYVTNAIRDRDFTKKQFNVEKVIDFNNCRNRLNDTKVQTGLWSGVVNANPLQQLQQKRIIEVTNLANYQVEILSRVNQPIIKEAAIRTIYTMTPFGKAEHGSHSVITIQQLQLLRAEKSDTDVATDSDLTESREGLRLLFPQEVEIANKEIVHRRVQQLMSQLVQGANSEINMEVYEQVLRIVRFHLTKVTDLQQITESLRTSGKMQQLRTFVLDLCPQIGSAESVQFLMKVVTELVMSGDSTRSAIFTINDIQPIFVKLGLNGNVQLDMIKAVFEVVKASEFRNELLTAKRMPIFKSGWLCLGAMMNAFYGAQAGVEPFTLRAGVQRSEHFTEEEIILAETRANLQKLSSELRRSIVQTIRSDMLTGERSDAVLNLGLQVLKNAGLFETYEDVSRVFLSQWTRKTKQRVQAIYATQKMLQRVTVPRFFTKEERSDSVNHRQIRPREEVETHFAKLVARIESDLLRTFRNVTDDPEVRIACYRVLIQSPISQTALSSLLQHIVSEPTVQVSSYCVEHLKQVAKKMMPRYQHVRAAVLAALPQLDNIREPKTDSYSRIFQSQMWDRLHQAGISVETDMILSDKAFTPRVSHIRFDHQAMGRNMPLLEITIRTEGLQRLLQKFFGPKGAFYSIEGSVMEVLRRLTRRSTDYKFDKEEVSRLEVLPRLLKELPDLDLTVSVMGNDLIDIEASQKMIKNLQKMEISKCLKSLSQMKKLLQPLISTFTMSLSAQVPTPVGTFLEVNALMNFDFRPELSVMKSELSETQEGKLQVQFSAPITVKNVQRIGSSMHVLEHFDLFRNELTINKDNNKMALYVYVKTNERNQRELIVKHGIPSDAALLKFKTEAKAVIRECRTDSKKCTTIDKVLQHSRIAAPTTIRSKPQLINNILAPLSLELEVIGSVFSPKGLYQAPCWNLLGSAHYTVVAKQIDSLASRGSALVYKLKLQGSYLNEKRSTDLEHEAGKFWLQVSQDSLNEDREISESSRRIMEFIVEAQEPLTADAKTLRYTGQFELFDQIRPESVSTKYSLELNMQQPENLQMQLRSLPLQSREWIQQRSARIQLYVKDESSSQNILIVNMKASTNQQLMQLLQQSDMSHETLIRMFPRLRACVQEAEKSLTEAQKSANKLYTPSCIRQLREFNQLSNLEFSAEYNNEQLKQCSACQLIKKPVEQLLQPYLVQYQPQYQRQSGMQKMTLRVQASPVDSRVMNVNASMPWAKAQWSEIQLPAQPFFWDGVENFTTAASDYVKGGDASCKLMNSHVKTFDGVVVSIPERVFQKAQQLKCGVTVARDCSPSNLFNLRSYVTEKDKTIVLQIRRNTQFEVVTIKKSLDDSSNALVMWRNRMIDDPENPKPAGIIASARVRYPVAGPAVGAFNFDIRKFFIGEQAMYELIGREVQLQFVIGGPRLRTVQVRASPFYNNKMCGLCGDYNSEKLHEFKGTDGVKLMRSAEQLFKEYIEPDTDSCRELQQSAEWNTEENKPEMSSQQQQQQWKRASHMIQKERTSPFFMNFRQKFSCKILNGMRPADQQVVTISNAHISLNSRIVKSIIQKTDCAVKIAQTKIANTYVRVYLKPASEQDDTLTLHFAKEVDYENKQHQATFNSRTGSFELPSELDLVTRTSAIISEGQEVGKKLIIENGNNHLTIRAFTNGEFDFQTTGSQMGGLCHLSSEHDIAKHMKKYKYLHRILSYETRPSESHLHQFAADYTSAFIDDKCAKQIRDASNKCEISQKRVQPFKNSPRSSQRSVQFLNNQLLQMAVRKNVIIPLSVDKVMGKFHNNVIALRFSSEGEKIFREFIVKFGDKTIATIKISQPFRADESFVTFLQNGEQRTITIEQQQQLDIDNGMKVQISTDSVKVFSTDGYGIEVRKDGDQKAIITRPTFSTSHRSAGLCQISNDQDAFQMDVHPKDVLLKTMARSLRADSENEVSIWSTAQRTHVESVLSLINPEDQTEQLDSFDW